MIKARSSVCITGSAMQVDIWGGSPAKLNCFVSLSALWWSHELRLLSVSAGLRCDQAVDVEHTTSISAIDEHDIANVSAQIEHWVGKWVAS